MTYKTNWKDFLKYDENGRRVRDWPSILVETGPGEKNYMYKTEYDAMLAAEKAVRNAQRAAREAELAASRPESINSAVTPADVASDPAQRAAVLAGRRGDPRGVPDFSRHSRRCVVCAHPDRDAIEGEFIRWRSPHKIARDYGVADRTSIYRHAHATGLFPARRRHVGRVLESYLETIDDNPPEDFDPVTRAVRAYAHLDDSGSWVEPRRVVHFLSSRVDSPWPDPHTHGPAPEPDFDPDPDPRDHPPTFDPPPPNDGSLSPAGSSPGAVGVEAPACPQRRDFTTGNDSLTSSRRQPPTSEVAAFGPESRRDDTYVAWHGSAGKTSAPERSTSGACPPRRANPAPLFTHKRKRTPFTSHQSWNHASPISRGEQKGNSNKPQLQNQRNLNCRKDIPKLNSYKNRTSGSPRFRLPRRIASRRNLRGRVWRRCESIG